MARRATYLKNFFHSPAPSLLISGGWEFVRPNGDKSSTKKIDALVKAFNFMKYDFALLSKKEAKLFVELNKTPDETRKSAAAEPFRIIKTFAGAKIGLLRLPSLPDGIETPTKDTIDKITRTLRDNIHKVNLFVALSDWGWIGEREYLSNNPILVPDVLLGSGLGSGVNGRLEANGRCIWVRPYDKGRTLNKISILNWPRRDEPFIWQEPQSYKCLSIGLSEQYDENLEVKTILQ